MKTIRNFSRSTCSIILWIAAVLAIAGCSTQNNGIINRAYHNTTSRYNGYFYSKESIKEGVSQIRSAHKDDYDQVLPIYIVPTEEEAIAVYPQMDRSLLKSSTVIKRHSMNIKGKEYCRWIDDNYLAMGKAHFYKRSFTDAEKVFSYVVKEYRDLPSRYDGMLWLIRTHVESGKLDDAGLMLGVANQDKEFPRKKKNELYKVNALYYTARKSYALAAENLEKAIPLEKRKKTRARLLFILAQLYQRADKPNEALKNYDLVAQMSNDYNMVFNARIHQAMSVADRVSGYKVKEDLQKMLRDDKNIEYQDQIYYALAEIAFKEKKDPEALAYLKKSAETSTTNVRQKSKSFLKLAQYYFNQKLYRPAEEFYDSAMTVLPTSYPEYSDIQKTAADLEELVKQLTIIQDQDSLLALANLPEAEREKKVTQVLKELQKKADEEAEKKKQAELNKQAPPAPAPTPNQGGSPGDFYFYSASARTAGYKEFKKKWGERKLEDNWRRSLKSSAEGGVDGFSESSGNENSGGQTQGIASQISKSDLEKNIPLTSAQRVAANGAIASALYNSGIIYKEKFKDNDNSIEAFENLLFRYKQSEHEASAYYQLYRMYLQKETKKGQSFLSGSDRSSYYYKELILTEYPQSEFARLVENPEYFKEAQAHAQNDIKDYKRVYALYKSNNLAEALLLSDSLIQTRGASPILSKFYMIKARIYGDLRNVDGYVDLLKAITVKFPKTEEEKEASRILALLKGKLPTPQADTTAAAADTTANTLANAEIPPKSVMPGDFKEDADSEHYLAVIFPNKGQDAENLKVDISNFNQLFFSTQKFDISNTFIDNDNQIIIVKPFTNKSGALDYHKVFSADKKMLKKINVPENKVFVISVDNFITLFKSKKIGDYMTFFQETYKK